MKRNDVKGYRKRIELEKNIRKYNNIRDKKLSNGKYKYSFIERLKAGYKSNELTKEWEKMYDCGEKEKKEFDLERTALILAILGVFFIVLGIAYTIFEGVHEDICNNTSDFKWYYENCMEKNNE